MEVDRPAVGEELNDGPPTTPRQAASVIIVRGGSAALEVLLLRRNPAARFMGGAWVFPGGAVDAHEGEGDEAHRLAAVREVEEEAGLRLPDPAVLVKFSRWITPPEIRIRFDTHFFLAPLPPAQEPRADGREMVALGWHTPAGALELQRADKLELVFPTIKHLEQLAAFPSAAALLEHSRGRTIAPVVPRVRMSPDGRPRIYLPGEPGYP